MLKLIQLFLWINLWKSYSIINTITIVERFGVNKKEKIQPYH